jgi:hypothetical protein
MIWPFKKRPKTDDEQLVENLQVAIKNLNYALTDVDEAGLIYQISYKSRLGEKFTPSNIKEINLDTCSRIITIKGF